MGVLGSLRLPGWALRPVLRSYARHFGVDMSEAERPLEAYRSFNDFFTRALKPGLRAVEPDPSAIVSPVDGRVYASGAVSGGTILQAKGVPYALAEFLGSADDARAFEGGSFATMYLSPRDYHRIHWPFDASVLRVRHLPGDLWPVNDAAVAGVPRLFARNERVVALGTVSGGAPFAMTPVGALNVGSIRLTFHEVRTNRTGRHDPTTTDLAPARAARRGEEFGRFEFGSAVVLLLSPGAGRLDDLPPGSTVRVGRRIGTTAS
jgi:phosphatidylserine decarboxylase